MAHSLADDAVERRDTGSDEETNDALVAKSKKMKTLQKLRAGTPTASRVSLRLAEIKQQSPIPLKKKTTVRRKFEAD